MKLTPLKNLVVLELIEEESRGGIFLPDNAKETNFGYVRALGPGKTAKQPIPLEIGNKVLIAEMGGRRELEYEGKPCWLIDADNILAVME